VLLPSLQELPVHFGDRPGSTGGRPLSAGQNPQLFVAGVRLGWLPLYASFLHGLVQRALLGRASAVCSSDAVSRGLLMVQVKSKEYGARGEGKKSDWQGTFIDQRH